MADYATYMESLQKTVQSKTAVPTAQVYVSPFSNSFTVCMCLGLYCMFYLPATVCVLIQCLGRLSRQRCHVECVEQPDNWAKTLCKGMCIDMMDSAKIVLSHSKRLQWEKVNHCNH